MGVGRSAIDSWKTMETARPNVDAALKLWRYAQSVGVDFPFHWFWDEDTDSLQTVVRELSTEYSTQSETANWLQCARGLIQVIISLSLYVKLSHPKALGEVLPLLSFAQLELESLRSTGKISSSEDVVITRLEQQIATLMSTYEAERSGLKPNAPLDIDAGQR